MSIIWEKPALWISFILLVALVTWVSFAFLPSDFSTARKLAAGGIGGAGFWLFVVTPRLIG